MKRARKDRPAYAFIRVGNRLVADMDFDLGALDGVAEGEKVRVEVSQWRNRPRLRAYWATLRDCINATDFEGTPETLHTLLKMECGLVDYVKLPDGTVIKVPGSIALEALDEDQMVQFFRQAEKYLAEKIGFSREIAA